jgi:hypothetical protein
MGGTRGGDSQTTYPQGWGSAGGGGGAAWLLEVSACDSAVLAAQLGTPRGRYDEHSGKSSLNMKPRFIEPVGERTNFQRLMLAGLATAPDNLYMAPYLGRSFAPAAIWNLHITQLKYFAPTYSEVINLTGLL